MNTRDRKPTRLKDFDYSSHGAYFVTICAKDRKPIFSQIFVGQGLAPAEIGLTLYGKIAEEQLHKLTERFPSITIDKYVIMPNHIHIIVFLKNDTAGASPCPTTSNKESRHSVLSPCRLIHYIDAFTARISLWEL